MDDVSNSGVDKTHPNYDVYGGGSIGNQAAFSSL
jgi:hypothetical protein